MTEFLIDGPQDAAATLLLAHGAGAPMDSAWMQAITDALSGRGLRVLRFEFAYMAARRQGQRKPPPRAEALLEEYLDAVARVVAIGEGSAWPSHRLYVGGKSLGGRVASMVADTLHAQGRIAGLVCLGYPFHPPGQPQKLRTGHLQELSAPALICQGSRDPFGTREEVAGYGLSPAIDLFWLEDGDHDFRPRRSLSLEGNLAAAADAVAKFASG